MNQEDFENETILAEQLKIEQEINQAQARVRKIVGERKKFGRPSWLKYSFLFLIAGIVDIVDVADFTGIGIVLAKIVSIAGTAIIYFTFWLTGGKMKRATASGEEARRAIVELQESVSRATRLALRASKLLGRAGFKGIARQLPRTLVKFRRIARRNPITKILVGGALNLIPWVALINLMIVWIYLSYRDEKKTLEEAKEAAQEAERMMASN